MICLTPQYNKTQMAMKHKRARRRVPQPAPPTLALMLMTDPMAPIQMA